MSLVKVDIPYGYCHCGCGQHTRVPKYSDASHGYVAGKPVDYIRGHFQRVSGKYSQWVVDVSTGCWIWCLALNENGYGVHPQKTSSSRLAHRVIYEKYRGSIPAGYDLDHLCRNRRCVNPYHMEPVPRAQNVRRGSVTKLTEDDVRQIKSLAKDGISQREIAERFGVHKSTVGGVLAGRTWREIV